MHRRHRIAGFAALLFVATASVALAGRPASGATLSVSPNDAPAWSTVSVTGCGYDAEAVVYLDIHKPSALAFYGVMPDAGGCFALTVTTDDPGTYRLETRQQLKGKRWTTMASYDLPVVL